MIDYKTWKILNLFEATDAKVSGPGIKAMQAAFHDMAQRGAPTEYNDYGFNKQDWESYRSLGGHLYDEEIPVEIATRMLRILSHYKNTQLSNYEQISQLVSQDFSKVIQTSHAQDKVMIFDRQPLEYGKVKVYIPHGADRSLTIAINKIVDAAFQSEGIEKEYDNYNKLTYPRYKKFSTDRGSLNSYRIHNRLINQVVELLKSRGMEVAFESGNQPQAQPTQPTAQTGEQPPTAQPQEPQNQDIEIIGEENSSYGKKLAIRFTVPFDRSKATFEALKRASLSPRGIAYASGPSRFLVNIDDRSLFDKVKEEIKKAGLNTSPLEDFAKTKWGDAPAATEQKPQEETGDKTGLLDFQDQEADKMKIKVNYRALDAGKKEFLKESIQYTFPEYRWNKDDYSYTVGGNYKQYITFGRLLKKFGYNVDALRGIVKTKLDSKRLDKTDWEGQHDDNQEFLGQIEAKLPESKFELYDEQKKGVAFLYGRDHAILGDETGLGKTVQLISAAALRMQNKSSPTLIITLKATQQQWVNEIINVMGEGEKSNITIDPLTPKKWTVVYYDNFSSGKKVDNYVESLANANFGIVIFDELHKVKHSTSKRSQNVAKVVENIPTRWGASATVSSNKPMDVRNQLVMTGHHLGKVSEGKFKKDFAGMEASGYKGAYQQGEDDDSQIKAAERLNRWLNLSGVYVRRAKSDVRDMPNLTVGDQTTPVDQAKFQQHYAAKVNAYKDPSLPISKLIAARETVAHLKTDQTTKKVLDIVASGEGQPPAASKVVVFTNFVESGKQLVEKINAGLRQLNPSYYALTYLSETKKAERANVKSRFTTDANAKALIMSMRMGGTGIDFPNASQHMVINDFDWTPEAAEQSEGRIYRINTNHPVDIEYMVGEGIDKKLFTLVQKKRKLAGIIQAYRKEYHEAEHSPEVLEKLVMAQKQMRQIDHEMVDIVNDELPGAGSALGESFRSYMDGYDALKELWLYGVSL